MKKFLLSAALIAASCVAVSAQSLSVSFDGKAVEYGSTITINRVDVETWNEEGYAGESYKMEGHFAFTNLTSNTLMLSGKRTTVKASDQGWRNMWCIGMSCVPGDVIAGQEMAANQTFEGMQAHIYLEMGGWEEVDGVKDGEAPSYGECEYAFNLYNADKPTDNFKFNVKYVYDANSPVYVDGELKDPGAVEGVELDSNATPVYYNLQGVRVANPEQGGVYIVRRGAKVAKEVIR